jgi:hypothetical protein
LSYLRPLNIDYDIGFSWRHRASSPTHGPDS